MGKYFRNIFYYASDFTSIIYVCIATVAVLAFKLTKGSKARKIVAALLSTYACFILSYTVFARAISDKASYILTPFWSYPVIAAGGGRGRRVLAQVIMNIVLGIPIGALLPGTLKTRFLQTVLCGLLFSIVIECLQLFTHTGLCEVDDIIHNTIGTALGYSLFTVIHCIREKIHFKP